MKASKTLWSGGTKESKFFFIGFYFFLVDGFLKKADTLQEEIAEIDVDIAKALLKKKLYPEIRKKCADQLLKLKRVSMGS